MLIVLTCAALAVRVIVALLTIDVPGDGPSHAANAYGWCQHPYFEWSGLWLPGNMYLAGLFTMIYPNPLVMPRVMNIVLGTMTIPLFYLLVREFYDVTVAMLAALALAAFPLHIDLSASSLTEPEFLFFVIAALLCLKRAVASDNMDLRLVALFVIALVGAEMTRYEGWAIAPLALGYLFWRTRNLRMTIGVALALSLFPAIWMIASYQAAGNPLHGLDVSVHSNAEIVGVKFRTARWIAYIRVTAILGRVLLIAAVAALLRELWRLMRRRISVDQAGYALFVAALWTMIIAMAPVRGWSLGSRLLLLGCTLLLPFAVMLLVEIFGRSRYGLAAVVLIIVVSYVMVYRGMQKPSVTREMPTDIIAVARWLQSSPYRNDAVLLTKMKWQSTYLGLYDPGVSGHWLIVSEWAADAQVRRFAQQKPALMITREEDGDYRARAERLLGLAITPDRRVYRAGPIEVFDISAPAPSAAK